MFDMKMKENEKKRLEFEKRREDEVASRREKAERKAQELVEVGATTLLRVMNAMIEVIYCFICQLILFVTGAKALGGGGNAARCRAERARAGESLVEARNHEHLLRAHAFNDEKLGTKSTHFYNFFHQLFSFFICFARHYAFAIMPPSNNNFHHFF